MKQFNKSDLKDYMKVVTRSGPTYIKEGTSFNRAKGYNLVSSYEEDLTMREDSSFDIMEVYEPALDGWNLLWKREEPKFKLLFPKEMFRDQAMLSYLDGLCYSFNYSGIGRENIRKVTFTQEEIDAIPFNTDMFTKVEVEK